MSGGLDQQRAVLRDRLCNSPDSDEVEPLRAFARMELDRLEVANTALLRVLRAFLRRFAEGPFVSTEVDWGVYGVIGPDGDSPTGRMNKAQAQEFADALNAAAPPIAEKP